VQSEEGGKVTFILSLHGFGSYGNWTRHYFPLMDYKDKYGLAGRSTFPASLVLRYQLTDTGKRVSKIFAGSARWHRTCIVKVGPYR
jgi:hypothetical protein